MKIQLLYGIGPQGYSTRRSRKEYRGFPYWIGPVVVAYAHARDQDDIEAGEGEAIVFIERGCPFRHATYVRLSGEDMDPKRYIDAQIEWLRERGLALFDEY